MAKEAGPLSADDNESALRKEHNLFCLHVRNTQIQEVVVKAVFSIKSILQI